MDKCHQVHIYISGNHDITKDVLRAIDAILNDNFILGLTIIGYALAALVSDDPSEAYSATDCITTSKSLITLFSPITKQYQFISGQDSIELRKLLNDNNFIDVRVNGFPYHRFVLIKIHDLWYLLSSYAEQYTLQIKQVDAYNLLTNMNASTYNLAFETQINEPGYTRLTLAIGTYSNDYEQRLLNFLNAYITRYQMNEYD